MNRYGPHAQSNNISNWPNAVALMRDGAWFKFMDDVAMAKVAKQANPEIKVVGRFWRDNMQQFSLNETETRNRARSFIATWLNDSFMEASPYIDAIEDFNEYWAASHTEDETAARILWIKILLQVWEDEILSQSQYSNLERIKWCLGNAAVGNDIPWQVAQAATRASSGPHYLGYHGYISVVSLDYQSYSSDNKQIKLAKTAKAEYRENFRDGNKPFPIKPFSWKEPLNGQTRVYSPINLASSNTPIAGERSPNEFEWGSGRILQMDEYVYRPRGIYPKYIFTEGGLVRDANGRGNLMPNDGWSHSLVTNGNMDRYVELMGEVSDLYREWNSNNNDRLEGYVYFTSGDLQNSWKDFDLNGDELNEIILRTSSFEGTSVYPPPPPPPPPNPSDEYEVNGLDISHWQGGLDGEISRENGNEFIIVKASDGFVMSSDPDQSLIDPAFQTFTEEAVSSGHLVGAYHFFQPKVSASRQALAFLSALELVEQQNLPPILDLEVASFDFSKAEFQSTVLEWLNIVEDQTGQIPMLYTNVSFYDLWLNDAKFDKYPLWIAFWSDHASKPSLPFRRNTWELWQWTSKGSGAFNGVESAYVDLNRFNGDLYEFLDKYSENWLNPVSPPPPPEPPEPCHIRKQYVRVVHVIKPTATDAQKQFVFDSVSNNLQTITFSYDDAGATPCIDNTAVLWFLTEDEKITFEAWFAEHYPRTNLAFVGDLGSTSTAPKPILSTFIPWWRRILLRLRR